MGTTLLVTRLKWNNRTYIATALYQGKKYWNFIWNLTGSRAFWEIFMWAG